jgi:hypothetical protein
VKIDDFLWFTAWVNQRLGACLTFARGLSWQQLLDGFGIRAPGLSTEQSLKAGIDGPRVEVGANREWAWAIERFTAEGSRETTLGRLSAGGHKALALTFTQLSTFRAPPWSGTTRSRCGGGASPRERR